MVCSMSFDQQDELDQRYYIDLFTLPYTFKDFLGIKNCILSKSTCPYDDKYLTCDHVIDLYYGSSYFTDSIISRVRFRNIQNLSLSLPFNDQFLTVVSKLDQLTSLSYLRIDKNENLNNIQSQLQLLLDQTPRLHSLSFHPWLPSNSQVPLNGNHECFGSSTRITRI